MQLKRNHADASTSADRKARSDPVPSDEARAPTPSRERRALIALAGRLHRLTIEGYLYSSDIRVGFATI
jgi:hypothetical protein